MFALFQDFLNSNMPIDSVICLYIQKNLAFVIIISKLEPEQKKYNILKLPSDLKVKQQNYVIGIIDASGSMQKYWKQMVKFWNDTLAEMAKIVITFDNNAKVQPESTLSDNLKKHGGGGTNILKAFQLLQKEIEEFIMEISFTIIFISDGQDTYNGAKLPQELAKLKGAKGRNINFICLGIENGFPTTISMALREQYHRGQDSIPALYLIEYASEKAFFNKFQTMKNAFTSYGKIDIKPAAREYPWEPVKTDFYEGTWVLFQNGEKQISIFVDDAFVKKVEIGPLKDRSIEEFVDCIRGWVQKIQIISIDKKRNQNIKKQAENLLNIVTTMTKTYQQQNKLSLISENKHSAKTFKDRALEMLIKHVGSRIQWYIDQLTVLMKGLGTQQLSEFEAAKRIGIGTITGKYHQKALALKGITVADFTVIKYEFKKIYSQTKLSDKESSQEASIFTLQNQKQIFQEADLLEGLDLCKSQFDLVQTFPVVGYSLKVKRYDGSMVNPWKVVVTKLALHHKSIDSMYLAKNYNKFELKIGEEGVEQINAVLPLYRLSDKELAPLLNTRLFRLAVSFMVVQNIDTYHTDAYLALLANTYIYLLGLQDSEWKTNLIQSIYESIKVTYGEQKWFEEYILKIEKNPYELFKPVAEFKQEHVDITRVLILIFYITKENRVSAEQLQHLVHLAVCHYTEKTFVENEFKYDRIVQISEANIKELNIEDQIIQNGKDIELCADKIIKKEMVKNNSIEITPKIFLKEDKDKQRVTLTYLKKFYKHLLNKDLEDSHILYYFAHYTRGKNEQIYNSPVIKDIVFAKEIILSKVNLQKLYSSDFLEKSKDKISKLFIQRFQETHFGIMPLTKEAFRNLCAKKGLNPKDYYLSYKSGLLRNACQSQLCPFYLKPIGDKEMVEHMKLWRHNLPPKFHWKVKQLMSIQSPKQIYTELAKTIVFSKYKKEQQFVIDYITKILKCLKEGKDIDE